MTPENTTVIVLVLPYITPIGTMILEWIKEFRKKTEPQKDSIH